MAQSAYLFYSFTQSVPCKMLAYRLLGAFLTWMKKMQVVPLYHMFRQCLWNNYFSSKIYYFMSTTFGCKIFYYIINIMFCRLQQNFSFLLVFHNYSVTQWMSVQWQIVFFQSIHFCTNMCLIFRVLHYLCCTHRQPYLACQLLYFQSKEYKSILG